MDESMANYLASAIPAILDQWLFFGLALMMIYMFISAIYNYFFSPLAKYPGPLLAKISVLPSFYYSLTGYRHIWVWQCHQFYGDIFRYQPNGLLVNSPSGYRDIYSGKANVKKGRFFEVWKRHAEDLNVANTTDPSARARKKRVLSTVFSEQVIRSAELLVIKHVDRWCELLLNDVNDEWSQPKNMTALSDCLMFDIVGDLIYGRQFDTKELGDNPFRDVPRQTISLFTFMYSLACSSMSSYLLWLKPKALSKLVARTLPRDVKKVEVFLKDCIAQRTEQEKELQSEGSENIKIRKDMNYYLHQLKDPDTGAPFYNKEELESENGLLLLASLHSPSAAICGFFFYIIRNSRAYSKVTNEIRSTFKSIDEIRTGSRLSACHYLRACIDEALRLIPAGPAGSPREVLPGGLRIDGEFIPEGVEVGTSTWALHQNENCFGDPHVFRPERWITDEDHGVSAEDVARAQGGWYPFSHGPTKCIGKNLAMMELKIILARTLFQMDIIAPPGLTLGEGSPKSGWGRRNKNIFQFQDALINVKDGPMIQVRKRAV